MKQPVPESEVTSAGPPLIAPAHWKRLLWFALLERFCYYGVRSIFVLYLIQRLSLTRTEASPIYEMATVLVYLLPVLGAWLADYWWGTARTLWIGSLVLVLGTIALVTSAELPVTAGSGALPTFLLGMGLVSVATGLLKPAYAAAVGQLTRHQPAQDLPWFYWSMLVVNVGAFIAPLLIGTLADTGDPDDFKWGFVGCSVVAIIVAVLSWGLRDESIAQAEEASEQSIISWPWALTIVAACGAVVAMLGHWALSETTITLLEAGGAVVLLLSLLFARPAISRQSLMVGLLVLALAFVGLTVNVATNQPVQAVVFGTDSINPMGMIILSFFFIAGLWFLVRRKDVPLASPARRVLIWSGVCLLLGLAIAAFILLPARAATELASTDGLLKGVGLLSLLLLMFFETTWNVVVPVVLAREMPPHVLARILALFTLLFALSYKAAVLLSGS